MKSLVLLIAFLLLGVGARAEGVSFVHDIAPIMLKSCTGCHGERTNQGGYRAHTYESLMKAGGSGKAAVVPGNPAASLLFQYITATNADNRMPLSDDALPADQISLFRRWIAGGAKFDGPDPKASLKSLMGPRQHPNPPAVYRAATPVMALTFAPGGRQIAVGGYNEVLIWDTATGHLVRRIPHLPQRIQTLAWSHDGAQLLVGGGTPGEYGEVSLVTLAGDARPHVLDTFGDIVLSACFSPDGKQVAAGGADASIRAYDRASGKPLWTTKVHADWITSVSYSFDNQYVASASKDMTVKVYEAATGALFATYNGHNRQIGEYKNQSPVYAVRFAPDTLTAYSAGGGKWIQAWNPIQTKAEAGDGGDMEERFAKKSHTAYLPHGFTHEVFALTVQGGQIWAASADGVLKQFDLATQKEVRSYPGAANDWIFAVDYDPATHRVATGSFNGTVTLWDTATGKTVLAFQDKVDGRTQKVAVR